MLDNFLRSAGKFAYRHQLAVSVAGAGFLMYAYVRAVQMWTVNLHVQSFPVAGSWGLVGFVACTGVVYAAIIKLGDSSGFVLHMWIPCIVGSFAAAMAMTASVGNPTSSERTHDMWAVTIVIGVTMLLHASALISLIRKGGRRSSG